jgi:hypothetical protein
LLSGMLKLYHRPIYRSIKLSYYHAEDPECHNQNRT